MNLEACYLKQKSWYASKYGADSWQWNDEGRVYAIMDYLSSCEMTAEDWEFAKREGITDLVRDIEID